MAQIHDLFGKVGSFYPQRDNFPLTPDRKAQFTKKLNSAPVDIAGRRVKELVRSNGLKLVFDGGSWCATELCNRVCGTEPVVRIDEEARSEQDLSKLAEAAKDWVSKTF
jgi:phosphomannomutase